jgi:electron transport complex protein RnfD
MRDVLLATVPGVLVMTWFFGPGTLINLVLGAAVALALEYGVMALRGRDPRVAISDLSVLVTSTLLCIALPPYAPWWLIVIAAKSASTAPPRPTETNHFMALASVCRTPLAGCSDQ